ncbi:MAG: hypothetical protein NTX86_01185 [Candidatus Dependentiae bacterium]|nr:hypothetical protein [Candidatus Dependentiae bacterium]
MKLLKNLYFILALCTSMPALTASDKILIVTQAFNRPDFIKLQHKTFRAFLNDDYEFVVFNDANNVSMQNEIQTTCQECNIRCINIPQAMHYQRDNPCARSADAVQYSLNNLGFNHDGIVFVIDSDMFLIKPFSITEFLQDNQCDLYGCLQQREHVTYIWNGLVFMNMRTLPNKKSINFDYGKVEGQATDVGGHLHYYLKNNPSLRVKLYSNTHLYELPNDESKLRRLGYDSLTIHLVSKIYSGSFDMELHAQDHFLHYRAGGNWNRKSPTYHSDKTALLHEFIDAALIEYSENK